MLVLLICLSSFSRVLPSCQNNVNRTFCESQDYAAKWRRSTVFMSALQTGQLELPTAADVGNRLVFVAPITSWGYISRQTGRRYSRTLDCAAVCCEAENSSWRRFTRRCNLSAV